MHNEQDRGPQDLRMRDPRPWVGIGSSRHERPRFCAAETAGAVSTDTATRVDGNIPTPNAGFPTPRERVDWYEHTQNQTHMGD